MPIKYIGRKTDFKGKPLWEIVGNLKNGGVGRIVARHVFERYPEPSFMKILKVEAVPNEETRKVKVLCERTFRGVKFDKPVEIYSTSYKADYQLIPKEEEAAYCRPVEIRPKPILPRTIDFPPLYKEILIKDMKAKKIPIPEDLKLTLRYRATLNDYYKIADEGETPTVELQLGVGNTPSPRLYANIKKPEVQE